MPRQPDVGAREQKRAQLLDVAAAEFARHGFERANINTISERAGFGKGTVYLYAASKEQLFLNVLEEIGAQTSAALDATLPAAREKPAQDRLRAVGRALARFAADHPDFVRLQTSALLGVNRRFQEACAAMLLPTIRGLARAFEEDMARGALRRVAPDTFALLVFGALQTLALLPEAMGYRSDQPGDWQEIVGDVLWHGLAPDPGRS